MGPIFHGKMVLGAKFYGILAHDVTKNFRLGPSFHGILVPRTNFTVSAIQGKNKEWWGA